MSQALCHRSYTLSLNNYFLFVRKAANSNVFIAVYMDDIILIEDDLDEITDLKGFLHVEFKIKEILKYFLVLEIFDHSFGVVLR